MTQADSSSDNSSGQSPDKPVGCGKYRVRPGDCIETIAFEHGHFWKTVWEHPDNAELREVRRNPNLLCSRDRVSIPPLRERIEPAASETTHTYKVKGVPFKLTIQLMNGGKPRADEPYILEIDGKEINGKTDSDGWVRQPIDPRAKEAKLKLTNSDDEYEIALGHLDPIDSSTGQKQRLHNLGFLEDDDASDEELAGAIRQFQIDHDLEATGISDEQTLNSLLEIHCS